MSPFIPTGYLTVAASVDCVVELMQGEGRAPSFTKNERATLLNWRSWLYQIEHPRPQPVTPVPKVGDRGVFVARTPGEKYPHKLGKAEPPRPNVTPEEIKALIEKDSTFKEQQRAAEKMLRQLLYAGRVPWEIIAEDGARIALPKHLSGGNQWYESLRSNRVTFRPGILSVTGFPVIPQDALKAAFNSDGTVKEKPEPSRTLPPHDGPDSQTVAEIDVTQGDAREAEHDAPRSDVTPPLAPVNAETTDIEAEYAQRVSDHRAKTGRRPTFEADNEWRKSKGLKRDTLRHLRQKNRTDEEKKGGHPPRP